MPGSAGHYEVKPGKPEPIGHKATSDGGIGVTRARSRPRVDGTGLPDAGRGRLEGELQADLEIAGPASSRDDAEVAVTDLRIREVELRGVCDVERL